MYAFPSSFFFILFYFILFYFIITLGIHLQYSYTVLTYNKTTKFTYVTALLLTCLHMLLTYIKIAKTSLQQTKGLLLFFSFLFLLFFGLSLYPIGPAKTRQTTSKGADPFVLSLAISQLVSLRNW